MTSRQNELEEAAEQLNKQHLELCQVFRRTSDVAILEKALGCITQAIEKTASEAFACSGTRAAHLTNLGRCQTWLFEATGNIVHLDGSINAASLAVQTVPESSQLVPICHVNLSNALAQRYFFKGVKRTDDFDKALEQARIAVATTEEDSEYFSSARSTLASRLAEYFNYIDRDDKYMDEAIQINTELVEKTSENDELYGVSVVNLSADIQDRFRRYGKIEDLLMAKKYSTFAIKAFPPGSQYHLLAVRRYAEAVYDIVDTTGETKELEAAIEGLNALELKTHNAQDLAKIHHEKSRLYEMKYRNFSDPKDLDRSVQSANAALNNLSDESGFLGIVLQRLSNVLAVRAEMQMSLEDINAAIDYARQSADVVSGILAREAVALNALANRYATKFELFGGMQNLKDSMAFRRRQLELLPEDHKDRPMRMHALAITLRNYFEQYGSILYLDESIVLERNAVESLPKSSPERPMVLDGLSHSLSERCKITGDTHDLQEAITASEAAVDGLPSGHKDRSAFLNGLSNRLNSRYSKFKNRDDLDRAITAATEAVSACEGGSSSYYIYLNTLSSCLHSRFEAYQDPSDLDKTIEIARQCLHHTPISNPFRINALSNLGLRLQTAYFRATEDEEKLRYLEESLHIAAQCVDQTPKDHPSLPGFLSQLAGRQLFLAPLMHGATDEELLSQMMLAASTYEQAFNQTYDTPLSRIRNGEFCGYIYMERGNWENASRMLMTSVGLFRRVSPLSLNDNDRQRQLHGLSGISSLACACFIAVGNPEKGLEVLEAGRGIMANIAMGYHTDLSDLRNADAQLHNEYIDLRNRLSEPLPEIQMGPSHGEDIVAERNADLVQFEALESKIRDLPGFETFNRSMTAESLRKLAVFGPIVAFCTVDQRCDAIIVTQAGIEAIRLLDLKNSDIKVQISNVVGKSRLSLMAPSRRGVANKKMRHLLEWIWDKAVQPVLEHLHLLGDEELPPERKTRLWWVTSGPMGLLPLHAAGKGSKIPLQNTYAHIISSYIPSFASLAFARQCQEKVDVASPAMALITMPHTPGGLNSLATEDESQAIREVFATSSHINVQLRELCQPSAEVVFHHIRDSNVDMLHLACHAEPDFDDPSNTALLFGSDPNATEPDQLPVGHLRHLHTSPRSNRRPPRLAYLSACCTAQQYDLRLIDENIHLASAFQLCGFPAVVGTLWEADDAAAVEIVKAFYKELFRLDRECREGLVESQSGYHVARALDYAIGLYRRMKIGRGSAAMDALAWAGFVHIGA